MGVTLRVAACRCDGCNHEWEAKSQDRLPKVCPKCKRRDWNAGPAKPLKARAILAILAAASEARVAAPPPAPATTRRASVPTAAVAVDLVAEREASRQRQAEETERARAESQATERRIDPDAPETLGIRPREVDGTPVFCMDLKRRNKR